MKQEGGEHTMCNIGNSITRLKASAICHESIGADRLSSGKFVLGQVHFLVGVCWATGAHDHVCGDSCCLDIILFGPVVS